VGSPYSVIKMKELQGEVGLSRSRIYALIKEGQFPTPIRLIKGGRATGFLRSEVDDWLKGRIDDSRRGANEKI